MARICTVFQITGLNELSHKLRLQKWKKKNQTTPFGLIDHPSGETEKEKRHGRLCQRLRYTLSYFSSTGTFHFPFLCKYPGRI